MLPPIKRCDHPSSRRRHRLTRRLLAATALSVAFLACGDGQDRAPERPGDVLLITVDTLRADHLGIYGYERSTSPRLDAFFAEGLVIDRAYATEANTSPSVVSVLTGLLPQQHGVRLLYQLIPDETKLLVDALPEAYQTAAVVSNIVLTDEALGLARRFDHYDDWIEKAVGEPGSPLDLYERDARQTTDAALAFLATERDPARPLFLWIHYIDPHGPYAPPADRPTRFDHDHPQKIDPQRVAGSVRKPGVDDALVYVDAYDEEIAYTDAEIGRLLDGYARAGDLDRALVVFTADHGESMVEHEMWFAHGYHVYDEIVRVPLMLRGPGVPSGRVAGLGSIVDIAPTILAFAGAPLPDDRLGLDLRSQPIPDDRTVFAEATSPLGVLTRAEKKGVVGYWRVAIRGDEKWMIGLVRGNRSPEEKRFYDLELDPAEQRPEDRALEGAAAEALLELIESDPDPGGLPRSMRRGIQIDAPKVAPRATEEQRARLRALGYVE